MSNTIAALGLQGAASRLIRCRANTKRTKKLTTITCTLETQRHFRRRLETKGWENPIPEDNSIVSETWSAAQHIYGLGIIETPLTQSPWLQEASSASSVSLKLETQQITGSFKARGAAHKIISLLSTTMDHNHPHPPSSVITSSTGNHALGVLHACSALSSAGKPITATIFVPTTLSPLKASKLKAAADKSNAIIIASGVDCIESERAARDHAQRHNQPYISPYNDLAIAGGQGTIALELCLAVPPTKLDAVFVPVGGGGLISGIAAFLKTMDPTIKVYGCQPQNSDVMLRSIKAGRVVDDVPCQETLSDGTAGGIESDSITFEHCQQYVDEWVVVDEQHIAKAMLGVQRHHGIQLEGSAGVAVASFLTVADSLRGKHAVIVCCGGNVSQETYEKAYELVRDEGAGVGGESMDDWLEKRRRSKEGSAAAF